MFFALICRRFVRQEPSYTHCCRAQRFVAFTVNFDTFPTALSLSTDYDVEEESLST